MYLDRQIKKEIVTIIDLILFVLMLFFGVSYAYFVATDSGESNKVNIGDLEITFCDKESCKNDYENFGEVIGTKVVNGKREIEGIYPYSTNKEAILETPYIFNIKNTGSLNSYLTIKLNEDKDYKPLNNYESLTNKYSNYINVGISDCSKKIDRENATILNYSSLSDNIILKDDLLNSGEDKTYCLWTFLNSDTPNEAQNSYFVANLDFSAEYKPKQK